MYNLQKSSSAHCRSDRSVRLMRWISIIKLRELSYTMLADILKESLYEILRSSIECRAHHAEAEVNIWSKEVWECATLMISEVTVNL